MIPDGERVGEASIALTVCRCCGRRHAGAAVDLCTGCGADAFTVESCVGDGTVVAATWTDAHSFAVVDLLAGVRLLAFGDPERRFRIGESVTVTAWEDTLFHVQGREP